MRNEISNRCSSLCKKVGRERLNLTLLLLLVSIISALSLAPPCAAQSGYEIRSAVVTPEYGYEDFTYSAQVWMSEEAASRSRLDCRNKIQLETEYLRPKSVGLLRILSQPNGHEQNLFRLRALQLQG